MVPTSPVTPPPEEQIGYLLVRIAHALTQRWTHDLSAHGLTARQHGVLAALDSQPDISAGALARTVMITPQAMGELLSGLLERGLVDRSPPPGRGRAAQLRLTDAGRRVLEAVRPVTVDHNAPAALGLDDDEAAQLRALLQRVLAATTPPANR